MVATSRIEAFVPANVPITAPVTKFGGQPVWLSDRNGRSTRHGTSRCASSARSTSGLCSAK